MKLLNFGICLLFFLQLFSSCSNDGLEERFATISEHMLGDSTQLVFADFDQETETYFEELIQSAADGDLAAATSLGYKHEILISTLKLYDFMSGMEGDSAVKTEGVFASETMLRFFLELDGVGVFRSNSQYPIRFREVQQVGDNTAEVLVVVPTGDGAIIGTTYIFNKEDNDWKLNFPSTMRLMEKIYKQGQRKSGLDEHEYAMYLNKSSDLETQFQYRKYQ